MLRVCSEMPYWDSSNEYLQHVFLEKMEIFFKLDNLLVGGMKWYHFTTWISFNEWKKIALDELMTTMKGTDRFLSCWHITLSAVNLIMLRIF